MSRWCFEQLVTSVGQVEEKMKQYEKAAQAVVVLNLQENMLFSFEDDNIFLEIANL